MAPKTTTLDFENNDLLPLLFGEHNNNLKHLEKKLGIDIADRANTLILSGNAETIKKAKHILESLWSKLGKESDIGTEDIDALIRFYDNPEKVEHIVKENGKAQDIVLNTKKKKITPRSPNQAEYIRSILSHPLVFGLGPAGTGKTYLAVAAGLTLYLEGKIERLIFCRPAIEAGERLGFLPGDMKEKVDPYLRPIYDALQDMLPLDVLEKKMQLGEIEVAPLAFMRGRTLARSFIILDEGQNTTPSQMQMFLTRLGENSKMVINGDLTQTDLPRGEKSGLNDATDVLKRIPDVKFTHFTRKDVIRHDLVSKIVEAYESRT